MKDEAKQPEGSIGANLFALPLFLLVMRVFLAMVFIYSGWEKLMAPNENFMAVIEQYQFLKPSWIPLTAFFIPWVELIFGTFLVLGFMIRASAGVLGFFSAVFIVLLWRSLWLHLPISECGCFGSGITLAPVQAMILDVGLLVLTLVILGCRPRLFSLDERLHR